jgi:hypothetical protein
LLLWPRWAMAQHKIKIYTFEAIIKPAFDCW